MLHALYPGVAMNLRRKTMLALGLGLAFFICVLLGSVGWFVSSGFSSIEATMNEGFDRVERDDALRNLQRLDAAFASELEYLYAKVFDWSSWDDAYEYVVTADPAFVEANITDDALHSIHVNLIAYFDTAGAFVGGLWCNPANDSSGAVPTAYRTLFSSNPALRRKAMRHDCFDIALVDSRPVMFAARPVLHGDGSGVPRGFTVLMRAVDPRLVAVLSRRVKSDVALVTLSEGAWPSVLPSALKDSLSQPLPTIISIRDARTILGHIILKDFHA